MITQGSQTKKIIGIIVFLITAIMFSENPLLAGENKKFSYVGYAYALKHYVADDGMVDYKGLKADRKRLDLFIERTGSFKTGETAGWSEKSKIAFWINIYNAITLKIIIDNYPIKSSFLKSLRFPRNSIRQIDGAWDSIKHRILGESITLDHIEHQILRQQFNEPRIHMALVCASMGCPTLRNEPYMGSRLDAQLDNQIEKFLKNPANFRINAGDRKIYVSSIFKWFGADFVEYYTPEDKYTSYKGIDRTIIYFHSLYIDKKIADFMNSNVYSLHYLDYDWSLNERK